MGSETGAVDDVCCHPFRGGRMVGGRLPMAAPRCGWPWAAGCGRCRGREEGGWHCFSWGDLVEWGAAFLLRECVYA